MIRTELSLRLPNAPGALAGVCQLMSDERVKDDIEPVGELFDGQTIYKYKYRNGDPRHHIGLLAQEVEDRMPDAVGELGPFKGVNYDKATSFAAELGRFI